MRNTDWLDDAYESPRTHLPQRQQVVLTFAIAMMSAFNRLAPGLALPPGVPPGTRRTVEES